MLSKQVMICFPMMNILSIRAVGCLCEIKKPMSSNESMLCINGLIINFYDSHLDIFYVDDIITAYVQSETIYPIYFESC